MSQPKRTPSPGAVPVLTPEQRRQRDVHAYRAFAAACRHDDDALAAGLLRVPADLERAVLWAMANAGATFARQIYGDAASVVFDRMADKKESS